VGKGVDVGNDVAVGSGVGVDVGVWVAVGSGVCVGVGVCVAVAVAVGVCVAVEVAVGVCVGVCVAVAVGVWVWVGVLVTVGAFAVWVAKTSAATWVALAEPHPPRTMLASRQAKSKSAFLCICRTSLSFGACERFEPFEEPMSRDE